MDCWYMKGYRRILKDMGFDTILYPNLWIDTAFDTAFDALTAKRQIGITGNDWYQCGITKGVLT